MWMEILIIDEYLFIFFSTEYELGESLPFRRYTCTTLFYAHFISWFSIIIWNNWLNHCCSNDKTILCACVCVVVFYVVWIVCMYSWCVLHTVRVWITNFNLNEMRYNFHKKHKKSHFNFFERKNRFLAA